MFERLLLILYTFDEGRLRVRIRALSRSDGRNHCRSEFGSFRELFCLEIGMRWGFTGKLNQLVSLIN